MILSSETARRISTPMICHISLDFLFVLETCLQLLPIQCFSDQGCCVFSFISRRVIFGWCVSALSVIFCIDKQRSGVWTCGESNRPCHLCLLNALVKLKQLCASNWLAHRDIFTLYTSLILFGEKTVFPVIRKGNGGSSEKNEFQRSTNKIIRINEWTLCK